MVSPIAFRSPPILCCRNGMLPTSGTGRQRVAASLVFDNPECATRVRNPEFHWSAESVLLDRLASRIGTSFQYTLLGNRNDGAACRSAGSLVWIRGSSDHSR